ncbi:hypothetical protein GCM10027037_29650 [Mucilaginibacter koreensis]
MNIYKLLICLSFWITPALLFAQPVHQIDYSKADTLALHIRYEGDLPRLTHQLTDPFTDQTLKARAIFRWITDNIAYDHKYYNRYAYKGKEPKTYHCNDERDCEIKKQVWENGYIDKALNTGKAVCEGYALLFKRMCRIAGIEAEMVTGYTRTQFYEIGTPGDLDHAWNAVWLNGTYHLLDATWAAGGCAKDDDGRLKEFHKHYNEYYWLTPAADFAKNHFPEDTKWVLLPRYTQTDFSANPFYESDVVADIHLIAPKNGIINAKRGDTVRFSIVYPGPVQKVQINSNMFQNQEIWTMQYINKREAVRVLDSMALKRQQYIPYRQHGNTYEFAYVVRDYSLNYLDILFDYKRVMRFKVNAGR